MHVERTKRRITGTGGKDKTAVMGILGTWRIGSRGSGSKSRKRECSQAEVREHVEAGAALYSDALVSYEGLVSEITRIKVIDHAERYVDGQVHTNGLENFWSLLKRGLSGTYVSVEPFHLFRYLDEQMFRYNNRGNREKKITDADSFNMMLSQIAGKRLTYKEVTGKVGETAF